MVSLALRGILSALFVVVLLVLSNPANAQCLNPAGTSGTMIYNTTHDTFQGCTPTGWVAFHGAVTASVAPTGCPVIGNVCANGMIYAGDLSGNKLYIAANDAPTTMAWDPDLNWPPESNLTGMVVCDTPFTTGSCITGRENTTFLKNHPDSYPAAEYCSALSAHGNSGGWYLPSRAELNVAYVNLKSGQPAGTFNFLNAYYWSSSEFEGMFAYRQDMGPGWQDAPNKDNLERVRCMWRS